MHQAEALLFALKIMGYKEYYGIDINPERMPVKKAIEINTKVIKIMKDRVDSLPYDKIIDSAMDPVANRGEIEIILADMMKIKK